MNGAVVRIKKAVALMLCLCVFFTSTNMTSFASESSESEAFCDAGDISENEKEYDISASDEDNSGDESEASVSEEEEKTAEEAKDEIVSLEIDCSDYVYFLGGHGVPRDEFSADNLEERYNSNENDFLLFKAALEKTLSEWQSYLNVVELDIYFASREECAEQVKRWVSQVLNEHGEFFYCTGAYRIEYDVATQKFISLDLVYSRNLGKTSTAFFYEKLEEAYNAAITDESWSDYDKALALHDWLTTHCSYVNTSEYDDYIACSSAYGPIVEGIGVCDGYAYAYQLLLRRAGIECLHVTSIEMNHAWNVINLDGQWYHVDCCWDDPVIDTTQEIYGDYKGVDVAGIRHSNFLRSDSGIRNEKHYGWAVDYADQVQCSSTKYDNNWATSIGSPIYNIGGSYYYLSGTYSDTLSKRSGSTVITLLSGLSRKILAYDGHNLFFAVGNNVYKCVPGNTSKTPVYSYTSSGNILGLRITGDTLRVSVSTGGSPKYKYIDISISSKTDITDVNLIVGDVEIYTVSEKPINFTAYVTKGVNAGSVLYEWSIYKSGKYETISGVTGATFAFLPQKYVSTAGNYKIKVTAACNGKSVSDEVEICVTKTPGRAVYKKSWNEQIIYGESDIYTPVFSDFDTNLPKLNIRWARMVTSTGDFKSNLIDGVPTSAGRYMLVFYYDEDELYQSFYNFMYVTISARTLYLNMENQNIYYGDSIDQDAYTLTGLAAGDNADVVLNSLGQYPGKWKIDATVTIHNSKGEDVTKLYSLVKNSATVTVNPLKVYITVKDQTIEQFGSVSSTPEDIIMSGLDSSISVEKVKLVASDNETIGNTGKVVLESISLKKDGYSVNISNYEFVVSEGRLTVEVRHTPLMGKLTMTYFENMTLADVVFSSEYGTWRWVTPETRIDSIGEYSYEAVFTSNDISLYSGGRTRLSFEITKGTLTVSQAPTVASITYSPEMTRGNFALKDIELIPGTVKDSKGNIVDCSYEWSYPSKKIYMAGSYTESYNVSNSNYYSKFASLSFKIAKATPVIVVSVEPLAAGEALADAKYTFSAHFGTAEGETVDGLFKWMNPKLIPSNNETCSYYFSPSDKDNYAITVGDITVTVKGARAQIAAGKSVGTVSNILNYGEPLSSIEFTAAAQNAFVSEGNSKSISGILKWENPDFVPEMGTYSAKWVFVPEDSDCEGTYGYIDIEVKKCITITVRDYNLVYGEEYEITKEDFMVTGLRGNDKITSYETVSNTTSAITTSGKIYMDSIVIHNEAGEDVSNDYAITMNKGKLVISKMNITVTVKNQDIGYGCSLSSTAEDVIVTGLPSNYEISRINLTADVTEIGEEGPISVSYIYFAKKGEKSSLSSMYYDLTIVNGTIRISKKAAPEVSFKENFYIGMKLADFSFKATAAGNWAWESPETELNTLGKKTFKAVFTPADTEHYLGGTVDVPFEVCKGMIVIKKNPTAGGEYSPAMAEGSVVLSDFDITGGIFTDKAGNVINVTTSWMFPDTVVNQIRNYSMYINIQPVDDRFESAKTIIYLTISKITPFIVAVSSGNIQYGDALSTGILNGEARYKDKNGEIIPGTFRWEIESKIPTVSGAKSIGYDVTFIPDDTGIYNIVNEITVYPNIINIPVEQCSSIILSSYELAAGAKLSSISFGSSYNRFIVKNERNNYVQGTLSWKNPDKIYTTSGTYAETWIFTPDDPAYLSTEGNVYITVKVGVVITVKDCEIEYGDSITPEQSLISVEGLPKGYSVSSFSVVKSGNDVTESGRLNLSNVVINDADGKRVYDILVTVNPGKLVIKKKHIVISGIDYKLPKGAETLNGAAYVTVQGMKNNIGSTIGVIGSIEYDLSVNVNAEDNGSFIPKNASIHQLYYSDVDITDNFDISYEAGRLIKPSASVTGTSVPMTIDAYYVPDMKFRDIELTDNSNEYGYWDWVNPDESVAYDEKEHAIFAELRFVVTDNYYTSTISRRVYVWVYKAIPYVSALYTVAVENGKKLSEYQIKGTVLFNNEKGKEMPGHFEWLSPETVITEMNGETGSYSAIFIPDDRKTAETMQVEVPVKVTPVYEVVFDANGGHFADDESKITVKTDGDGNFVLPNEPSMYNRIFTGWYVDDECKTALDFTSTDKTITVYAGWILKYTTSDVTAHFSDGRKTEGESVPRGTKVFLYCEDEAAIIYYSEGAFSPDVSENEYTDGFVIDEDITVYAVARRRDFKDSDILCISFSVTEEEPWGEIWEEDKAGFDYDPANIPDGIWVSGIHDMFYTGSSVTFPEIRVYDKNKLLKNGVDYKVSYKNNKKAAESTAKNAPSVTITGKANYSGKYTFKFSINRTDIGEEEFSTEAVTVTFTNKIINPAIKLTRNGKVLSTSDYYIDSYRYVDGEENVPLKNAGEYIAVIKGKGGYCGQREVRISVISQKLVNKLTYKNVTEQKYKGGENVILPKLQVYDGKKKLTLCYSEEEEGDILVTYSDNINVGTAKVIFEGRGNYSGIITKNFKIRGTVLSSKNVTFENFVSSIRYTSEEIKQQAVLYYGEKMLTEDEDYTVTYSKNIVVGKATATYKGIGIYEGTIKKTFKITPYALSKDDDKFTFSVNDSVEYTKGGAKTSVEVWFGGTKLVAGKDYTLLYGNNKKLSTDEKPATVSISGKGCFSGKVSFTYRIGKKDLSVISSGIYASSKAYSTKKGAWKSAPVLKDTDGKTLKSGTDYTNIVYTYFGDAYLANGRERYDGDIVEAGDRPAAGTKIKVTVSGKGGYTGTISCVYRISKGLVSSSTVSFKRAYYYNGKAVEPAKSEIIVKIGKTVLNDCDYDIISYSKNINAGTGYMVIKGKGNYSGTKTISFKIKTKSILSYIKMLDMFTALEAGNEKRRDLFSCGPYAA